MPSAGVEYLSLHPWAQTTYLDCETVMREEL